MDQDKDKSRDKTNGYIDLSKTSISKNGDHDLFSDLLEMDTLIKNRTVLRPSYTPEKLPHRDKEIKEIGSILVPALRGETPSNILIYGKTGTGKTASAKYVANELELMSSERSCPCEVHYFNCEVVDTQYRVLTNLAQQFGRKDVPNTGWPTDRVYDSFFNALDVKERVAVIMLDEIDKLVKNDGDRTLYNLSRMNSDLENARISVIGISNDIQFTDYLDPRVKSSLGEDELVFSPYNADQLRDILNQRAELAFDDEVLNDDVIPTCAAMAAQENGDARRALDLLRVSAEIAERNKDEDVKSEHVKHAQQKIELNRVKETVGTLPQHSKIVLYVVIELENETKMEVNTGNVYMQYKEVCHRIGLEELTQRRVFDLIDELDSLGIVNADVHSKGRFGRTKRITLSVPAEETKREIIKDSRLTDLDIKPIPVQSKLQEG